MPSGGYRPGVPLQTPYTKYDTDADEIRVEYKRVDNNNSPLHSGGGSRASSSMSLTGLDFHSPDGASSWFSGYKGAVLRVLVVVVVFMVGLVAGYILRRNVREMSLHTVDAGPLGWRERKDNMFEYQVRSLVKHIFSCFLCFHAEALGGDLYKPRRTQSSILRELSQTFLR